MGRFNLALAMGLIAAAQLASLAAKAESPAPPAAAVSEGEVAKPGAAAPAAQTSETQPEAAADTVVSDQAVDPLLSAIRGWFDADDATRGEQEQREWEALKSFYGKADARALWVDSVRLSRAGRSAVREMARADTFGLDARAFDLPAVGERVETPEAQANMEIRIAHALLTYARHAKGGRIGAGKLTLQRPEESQLLAPEAVLEAAASAENPGAYLRSLHPKHPQFAALRNKLLALRASSRNPESVKLPDGPVLKPGVQHPHVSLLRQRLGLGDVEEQGSSEAQLDVYDATLQAAVERFQRANGLKVDGVVGNGTRRALNRDTKELQLVRVLINMERLRWLPANLDQDAGIHVWANVPEFRVRIWKGNERVFDERMIVGKLNKMTPVMHEKMEWIELHPTWFVPNSIKVADILPSLRRRTSTVMQRYHLRLHCGRHGSDPRYIDWSKVNIRSCSLTQPPGAKSVLGDFKFKFPNKHAVYMHDTPTRGLFRQTVRTFSHGCMRIQNPRRMAEILLEHDKAMTSAEMDRILKGPKRSQKAVLKRHVPIYVTYLTALVNDSGDLIMQPDVYGHDRRLAAALLDKGNVVPVAHAPKRQYKSRRARPSRTRTASDWWNN